MTDSAKQREDYRWWLSSAPHDVVPRLADSIDQRQSYRRDRLIHYLRLYGDRGVAGYSSGSYARPSPRGGRFAGAGLGNTRKFSLNVVRNMVDAFTSRFVKSRPRVTFQTVEGDYSLQMRAKNRERFIEGCFHSAKFYAARAQAIKIAAICGDGFVKILEHHGEVRYESTFPGEILVDDAEAVYGCPRQLIQQHVIDRSVSKELWPSHAKAIENAGMAGQRHFGRDPLADQILVHEAWHLPSGPKAKDGRHVIVCDNATLLDEPWEVERFPFAHWQFSSEPLGFWGAGLGEILSGIQLEINQILRTIQNNIYLGGNLKVAIEKGSLVAEEQISNSLRGAILEYTGRPPNFFVHDIASNQLFQHLQWLVQQAYQVSGISQMSASGEIPAGLAGSGRAQLVYKNIESERFATFSRSDELAIRDTADVSLDVVQRIEARDGSFEIRYTGKRWLYKINAADVLGGPDEFETKTQMTAQLPHDPAGRAEFLEYLRANGYITREQAMGALEIGGDIDAELALENSPKRLIDEQIERILENGEAIHPSPKQNLEMAIYRGNLAWAKARHQGAPEENLDLLSQYVSYAVDQIKKQNPPAPEAAAPPGGPPPMPPMGGAP